MEKSNFLVFLNNDGVFKMYMYLLMSHTHFKYNFWKKKILKIATKI